MKLDSQGILFEDGTGFYWPFPRLRYRLRTGHWCEHLRLTGRVLVAPGDEWCLTKETEPAWEPGDLGRPDGWRMIEAGMRQMRRCSLCTHCEFR